MVNIWEGVLKVEGVEDGLRGSKTAVVMTPPF